MTNRILIAFFLSSSLCFSTNQAQEQNNQIVLEEQELDSEDLDSLEEFHCDSYYDYFKNMLDLAIEYNDLPKVVLVYLFARDHQIKLSTCATTFGVIGATCIGLTPVTCGLTAIFGVPFALVCGFSSVEAHLFATLKHRAQDYLKSKLAKVRYDILTKDLNDINPSTRSQIVNLIKLEGWDADIIGTFQPKLR